MKIIEFYSHNSIVVEFLDEYHCKVHTAYHYFKSGGVRNPYDKSIHGIGYLGEGRHKLSSKNRDSIDNRAYDVWSKMIRRCYVDLGTLPTYYNQVTVCDEWHCYQTFADWYEENYYECSDMLHLDKDIKHPKSKCYSPENCILIPKTINVRVRGHKNNNKLMGIEYYDTYYRVSFGKKHLGTAKTIKDAYQLYIHEKEQTVYRLAEKFKDELPISVYQSLKAYRCLIEDDPNYEIVKDVINKPKRSSKLRQVFLGGLYNGNHKYGSIYDIHEVAPCLDMCLGRFPMIIEEKEMII